MMRPINGYASIVPTIDYDAPLNICAVTVFLKSCESFNGSQMSETLDSSVVSVIDDCLFFIGIPPDLPQGTAVTCFLLDDHKELSITALHQFVSTIFELVRSESNPIVSYCNSQSILNHCIFLLSSFRLIEIALPPTEALAPFAPYIRVTGPEASVTHLLDAVNAAVQRGWYDPKTFIADQWATESVQCVVPHRFYLASTDTTAANLTDLAIDSIITTQDLTGWTGETKQLDLGDSPDFTSDAITAFLDIVHSAKSWALIRGGNNPDWKLQMLLISSLVLEYGLAIPAALGWLELCQFCTLQRDNVQVLKSLLGKLQTENRWAFPVEATAPRQAEAFGFSRAAQKHKKAREQLEDLIGAAVRQGEGHRSMAAENLTSPPKSGQRITPRKHSRSELGELE
jgi:hypothetical protein